jgi:epoxyqueuosine reductase
MTVTKDDLVNRAHELGFEDVGFTHAGPFSTQLELLQNLKDEYSSSALKVLDLVSGTDPRKLHPAAKTIVVLMEPYFRESYPKALEKNFGRCYLDDDRITKNRLGSRLKAFRSFLRENGIDSKVPSNLPHRLAAARAGMGTFGKNCLFYSNRVVKQGSWVLPIAVTLDREFSPGRPTIEVACPDWCRNVCIVACPTGALKGPRKIDPRKCISFLTYFGEGMTPLELREPMGQWVYGCDLCQNVCPRNQPWLSTELKPNLKAAAMTEDFELSKLLGMDREYFLARVWPHMFYMSPENLWRWKMNAARAMGNSLDENWVPALARALAEEKDERAAGMAAWALGRIGGKAARTAIENCRGKRDGLVHDEIVMALERLSTLK